MTIPAEDLPLHTIRVLDLTRVVAGPLMTKQLADLGADIVKIESIQVPDETRYQRVIPTWPDNDPGEEPWNTGFYFNNHNRNKRSLTIDISSGWGQEILLNLAKVCDVVAENYRPGVLEKIGLEYPAFKQANPDIIMVSMSGFGNSGPFRRFRAYGSTVETQSGLASLNGARTGNLTLTGQPYGDWCTGMFGVSSVLIALDHRRRTGQGQYIDMSQSELTAWFYGETVVAHSMTGKTPDYHSNHHATHAPSQFYRTVGRDEWTAIDIENDDDWKVLCTVMEAPGLADDPRFATAGARKANEAELDALVEAWTLPQDKLDLFHRLQDAGLAAGPVHNARDVYLDPQLASRDYFQHLHFGPNRVMKSLLYPKYPVVFDGKRPDIRFAAPNLGEHNEAILGDLLGHLPEEIEAMAEAEVIGTVPMSNFDWSPVDLEVLRNTDAVLREDSDYRQQLGLDS